MADTNDDNDNDSDIELVGLDMDDDEEEVVDDSTTTLLVNDNAASTTNAATAPTTTTTNAVEMEEQEDGILNELAAKEAAELEAVRKERLELIKAEQEALKNSNQENENSTDPQSRLEYLLHQSDVFAHFLAGSVAATKKKTKKGGKGGGKSTATSSGQQQQQQRLTEEEEDEQLLKSAQSGRHSVVRLHHQPTILAPICQMHPYQIEGLNWMIKLHDHGINGILADEMGLGKTLQTISLLAYLRESRGVKGPHIAIVPKSVVGNWIREFTKWCPSIKVAKMGGTKEERQTFIDNELPRNPIDGKYPFDVLVTSYEGLLKEKGRFGKVEWKYLIIDEAHRIKNENSSLSLAVRKMSTQFRLLITGTPLQNNLRELWALLNFLMPDIFGDAEQFDAWFSLSDESGKENVIKKLHTILRPFMLRRVKSDVAKSLPPKKETKLYVGLTDMQRLYYVHCLMKDAHELNKLGGPDRSRLLNVLMQLRKVCNHPYLFDGAEKGPPYIDGPHIWENSGKMQLLHKLLHKLQAQQSRVLIFSQMTRVLDILEDYMRLMQFEYCRIDGNTTGERRDEQVDEFNKDGSTLFVFLLSTRAGGLGINLATADIVILFDSDWNPQVDLQAMDRAHRIGQTKPVKVFRFITEGTVEEKIIERADRKLFLDAAVIQQGRLAEQNAALDKNDLMKMVRFGADQIVSGKGGTYTDEDIDALIARGEEKTSAMQAQLETDAQYSLANFTLLAEDETTTDTFEFGGVNYRDKGTIGNFINLPQRQRKRNYDQNEGENSGSIVVKKSDASKKKRKGPVLYDFQLFDMDRLNEIHKKEDELESNKEADQNLIATLRQEAIQAPTLGSGVATGRSKEELLRRANHLEQNLTQYELTDSEKKEREDVYAEGFPDWSRKDFKAFCTSLERHGRYEFNALCQDVGLETDKDPAEIARYFVSFWTNYQRIVEWSKILEKIERGEKKIQRLRQIREVIHEKVERHLEDTFGHLFGPDGTVDSNQPLPSVAEMLHYSWPKMKINYGFSNRGKGYQEEEDSFLVCMMYRHGYGAAERIRMEIRRAWQFRFDWYFKSRTAVDIQKRCDVLVKIVEREIEDLHKKEAMDEAESNNKVVGGDHKPDDVAVKSQIEETSAE